MLPSDLLASASDDKTASTWLKSGRNVDILFESKNDARSVVARPNGDVAGGSLGSNIHAWNVNSGYLKLTLPSKDNLNSLELLPNGNLANDCGDGPI